MNKKSPDYTDQTLMPFGKYKGTPLISVPADYLLWLHRDHTSDLFLRAYIEDNMQALMMEANKKR